MTDDSDERENGDERSDDPFAELDDVDVEADPFAELEDVDPDDDPFDMPDSVDDDLFTEVEADDVDEESVWADLSDAESAETAVDDDELPDVETAAEEHIVPKRAYCEKCEYFASPPETRCTNPGTEIRELVDMEHFRVANCPIVVQRRAMAPDDD